MKRKFADRRDWSRVREKSYKQIFFEDNHFKGYISLLHLKKVSEPLLINLDNTKFCIADNDYIWMQHTPIEGRHALTTMMNRKGKIVQWYFDIAKEIGLTANGVPYFDDLYLDVVALPNKKLFLLDEDELSDALENNKISQDDYTHAHQEAEEIISSIKEGRNYLINRSELHYQYMKSLDK